jgi:hypothetical protein
MRFTLIIVCLALFNQASSQGVKLNELMASNQTVIADEDGDYEDWIELYNDSDEPVNLAGYSISDDPGVPGKWAFPSVEIGPQGFLLVFASGKDRVGPQLHTSFKLSSAGEDLLLTGPDQETVDAVLPVQLEPDQPYGRLVDGSGEWHVLAAATPMGSNNGQVPQSQILFSVASGFYPFPFLLELSSEDTVYYTLNGSEPTLASAMYTGPISVDPEPRTQYSMIPTNPSSYLEQDKVLAEIAWRPPPEDLVGGFVIRARTFKNGIPSGKIYTQTYFNEGINYSFPMISIVTDSMNLFSWDSGIYVPGKWLDEQDPVWTGNYHQKGEQWERDAHLQYFDVERKLRLNQAAGIRIHGYKSRIAPQKSFRLYARQGYGEPAFDYSFFSERKHDSYKRLILRSSYTYWWRNTMFLDDMLHHFLAKEIPDLDIQMSAPAIVFLNGEYWGIQSFRERQDKYYLAALHEQDPENFDIIEGNLNADEGTADNYLELLAYVETHDLALQPHYEKVKQYIDIDNYIDYLIVEVYVGNLDWPGNNMKMWRVREPGSRWRWLVYDLDATFNEPSENSIERLYEADYPALFFREMMENSEFRKAFIDRFTHHLNFTFDPGRVSAYIDAFKDQYRPEMEEHISRWGNPASLRDWNESVQHLYDFVEQRPCFLKYQLIDFFQLDSFGYHCPNHADENSAYIFPNPCQEEFRISLELEVEGEGTLTLLDMAGRKVRSMQFTGNLQVLSTRGLPNGQYILVVNTNDLTITEKLMINK